MEVRNPLRHFVIILKDYFSLCFIGNYFYSTSFIFLLSTADAASVL